MVFVCEKYQVVKIGFCFWDESGVRLAEVAIIVVFKKESGLL